MNTRTKTGIGVFIALVALVIAIGWLQIRAGISAHSEPTGFEKIVARSMRGMAIPSKAKDLTNPLEVDEKVMASAREHWADHCASCHGNDGKGETEMGQGLYPKPPDMTEDDTQSLSDGELAYIIHNGVRLTGMPAWGKPGTPPSDADWELVAFIRHLPEITNEELEEMEALNPISPHELEERRAMDASGEDPEQEGQDHGDPGHHH